MSEIPQLMSMQSVAACHIGYKSWRLNEVVVHNGHKTWTTLCRPATGSLQQDKSDLNGARLEGHHLRPGATVTGHARDTQCPYGGPGTRQRKTEGRDQASVCRRHAQRDARDLHSARPEPHRSAPYATMKGHAPIARRRQGVWDAGRGKWRADKIWQGMPGSIGNAGDAGLGHSTGIGSGSEDARVCGGARSAQRRQEAWRRGDNPPHPTTRPLGKKIETVRTNASRESRNS